VTEELTVYFFGGNKKLFFSVVGVNFITHPTLHIVLFSTLSIYTGAYGFWYLLVLEVMVVLVEYKLLTKIGFEKRFSIELAICMNTASYLAGLFIFR